MRRHNEETPHLPRRVQRRTFAERKATTKLDTEFEILGLKWPRPHANEAKCYSSPPLESGTPSLRLHMLRIVPKSVLSDMNFTPPSLNSTCTPPT